MGGGGLSWTFDRKSLIPEARIVLGTRLLSAISEAEWGVGRGGGGLRFTDEGRVS